MKKNSTKRSLLASVLALVMCVSMLVGTTFAWFTDTASTGVNKIQAGTLDVQLLDEQGNSLERQTLSWKKAAGHENEAVLWEPGCTYELQPIVIKNNGNLALKYKIVISGIQGDAELNNAIEWTINDTALAADHALAAGASNTLTIKGHMREDAGNGYRRGHEEDCYVQRTFRIYFARKRRCLRCGSNSAKQYGKDGNS